MATSPFSAAHLCIELSTYAYVGLCLHRIWRSPQRSNPLITLLSAVVFAYMVEYAFVKDPGNPYPYRYGEFLVMLPGPVPLWVACGWGLIVHTCLTVTHAAGLPLWAKPIASGLLALSIDLVLDPVAGVLGYWDWGCGGRSDSNCQYFNVPLDNFVGWMLIVGSYTLCRLLAEAYCRARHPSGSTRALLIRVFVSILVIPASFVLVLAGQAVANRLYARIGPTWTCGLMLLLALLLVFSTVRTWRTDQPLDWRVLGVPLFYDSFLLVAFLMSGGFKKEGFMALLVVIPVCMVCSLIFFSWPFSQELLKKSPTLKHHSS